VVGIPCLAGTPVGRTLMSVKLHYLVACNVICLNVQFLGTGGWRSGQAFLAPDGAVRRRGVLTSSLRRSEPLSIEPTALSMLK
jgi:hypothetical protein